ncbi:hypothetical protein [Streptomyces xiamenensis]|uniref:hypothetical protein n=1 Tax=Streptomyces xiamenensis TaxID=408015 RepID=UPI0035DA0781
MNGGKEDASGEGLVGRTFTRSRRLPGVVGRLPGSAKPLIGGPYTIPQGVVMVALIVVMAFTPHLWARFGLVPNLVLLLGVPYGAGLVVRRLQGEGRSPWAAVSGVFGLLSAPGSGRMRGRPVKRAREVSTGGVLTLHVLEGQEGGPATEEEQPLSSGESVDEAAVVEGPVLSPVQAALARRRRERGGL